MSIVYGIVVILTMFSMGMLLRPILIPHYFIADSCRWQLPSVLEQNPVVAKWMVGWDQGWQERQSDHGRFKKLPLGQKPAIKCTDRQKNHELKATIA